MVGREVGGFANVLAAHMGFSASGRDLVQRFWNAANLVRGEGHKAVAMFNAFNRGEIKAPWVMRTNPTVSLPQGQRLDYSDDALGIYRAAVIDTEPVESLVSLSRESTASASPWLREVFKRTALTKTQRRALLAGSMPDASVDSSPIVSVCNQVSSSRIADAIAHGYMSADAVGEVCQAGKGCGSCLPEINRMISAAAIAGKASKLQPATAE
jgi:bacterioferritin-associated ferredoxin